MKYNIGVTSAHVDPNRIAILAIFLENVTLRGGLALVRGYMRELMEDIDDHPRGYAATDERKPLKVPVRA